MPLHTIISVNLRNHGLNGKGICCTRKGRGAALIASEKARGSGIAPRFCYRVPLPMADKPNKLKIAGREFSSRLMVGTGKFASNSLMAAALEASGAEIVTVALR